MLKLSIGVPIPSSAKINGGGYYLQKALITEILHNRPNLPRTLDLVFIATSRSDAYEFLETNPSVFPNQVLDLQKSPLESALSIVDRFALRPFRRIASSRLPPSYSIQVSTKKLKAKIDILWNLNPTSLSTEIPYILPVWDLQHRLQPFFPEVSHNGAWDIREEWYSKQIPRATLIITGTNRGAQEITQFYGVDPSKIFVNPLPLTLPLIVPSASIVRETVSAYGINLPYIIYPANFWPHKNHYHLLLAIKELKDQGLLLGLVLTGKKQGTYKSIYKLSIELGLDTQIYFTGLVDSTTLQALYVGSNGLCYPSLFGPDNLPPLEALALGVPVATADVPGAREQLNDQVLFFNPCSPSEISSSIRIMLDNPRICHTSRSSQQDLKNSLSSYVIRVIEQIEILAPYITCAHICRLTST